MRPQTSALLDQANAANADAARIMAGLAQLESTTPATSFPDPSTVHSSGACTPERSPAS